MFDRFTWMFSTSALIDGALMVLALCLIIHREFRSIGFWLVAYAVSAIYSDYNFGMEMRDKALGTTFATTFTFPPAIDFTADLMGRVALLVAIWLFFGWVKRRMHGQLTFNASA